MLEELHETLILPEDLVNLSDGKHLSDLTKLLEHVSRKDIIILPENEFICSILFVESIMNEFKKKSEVMAKLMVKQGMKPRESA